MQHAFSFLSHHGARALLKIHGRGHSLPFVPCEGVKALFKYEGHAGSLPSHNHESVRAFQAWKACTCITRLATMRALRPSSSFAGMHIHYLFSLMRVSKPFSSMRGMCAVSSCCSTMETRGFLVGVSKYCCHRSYSTASRFYSAHTSLSLTRAFTVALIACELQQMEFACV